MNKTLDTKNSYYLLLKQLKKEIAEGLIRTQKAFDKEKVLTYWKIGKSISIHLLQNKSKA